MGVALPEGWYRDPFAVHDDRWMSQGQPTKLVRDGGTESYDPPPDLPLPALLVPCPAEGSAPAGRSDLRRADEAGSSYSRKRARRAALDASAGGAFVDEPGGLW